MKCSQMLDTTKNIIADAEKGCTFCVVMKGYFFFLFFYFFFFFVIITKTSLYNFDPLKSHFYIVKLGFTGVHTIFLISAEKYIVGTR